VGADLGLPGFSFDDLAQVSMRKQFGLFAKTPGFVGKEFFEGDSLQTVSPHDAAPFLKAGPEGGSARRRTK
jgi:hypothetical protein